MKKVFQWLFGVMFAVALLLPMNLCYAYEGESEEEWVNRMWYNTQWAVRRVNSFLNLDYMIGRSGSLTELIGLPNYSDYDNVRPEVDCGRIYYRNQKDREGGIYIDIIGAEVFREARVCGLKGTFICSLMSVKEQ